MEWAQLLTVIAANAGLFLWARSESRADFRYIMNVLDAIKDEMKDFHARLCKIEEDRKK